MPRQRGMVAPAWAPVAVDVALADVQPLPGWVLLREQFEQDERTVRAGVELVIVSLGTPHTVYGRVEALAEETAQELGVRAGDDVVYREWEGGRWEFQGDRALMIGSQHILARVERGQR